MLKKLACFTLLLVSFYAISAQDTKPEAEKTERVVTEEVKINFSAFDASGRFVPDVGLNDFVVLENGRIHQPVSVRYLPASVLILLDVGSEIAYAKRRRTSVQAAKNLIKHLRAEDSVAVMQYAEKVSLVADWTKDKNALLEKLDERKLDLGKRSVFYLALIEAVKFLEKAKDNRHLVVITDGIDGANDKETVVAAIRNLFASDVNVHVVSWTRLQKKAIEENMKVLPNTKKPELPPGAEPPIRGSTPTYSIKSINLDREMVRKRKQELQRLKKSEEFLTEISEDTNGEIFLPETEDEMIEKMAQLAINIDSQYVATYVPKRPLSELADGETFQIEVFSRRNGLIVQGKRKLVIRKSPASL